MSLKFSLMNKTHLHGTYNTLPLIFMTKGKNVHVMPCHILYPGGKCYVKVKKSIFFPFSQLPFCLRSSTQRLTLPSWRLSKGLLQKRVTASPCLVKWLSVPILPTSNLKHCGTEMVRTYFNYSFGFNVCVHSEYNTDSYSAKEVPLSHSKHNILWNTAHFAYILYIVDVSDFWHCLNSELTSHSLYLRTNMICREFRQMVMIIVKPWGLAQFSVKCNNTEHC